MRRSARETWEALGRPPWWTWPLLLIPLGSLALLMSLQLFILGIVLVVLASPVIGAIAVTLGLAGMIGETWRLIHYRDLP